MKKVSICMMTYNNQDNLQNTLSSIAIQKYSNIELAIADGGSTDQTLDIIETFKNQHTEIKVKCVSEKDNGLYDALNKAVKMASGDFVLVMNDQLIGENAIARMVEAIERSGAAGCHADLIYASETGVKRFWHMGDGTLQSGWIMGHPTLMLKREIYEKYGLYDISYKIAADYEFEIRIVKGGERFVYVPGILVRMYYGGTSTSGMNSYLDSLREGHRALTSNHVKWAFVIDVLRTIRVLLQFLVNKKVLRFWNHYQENIKKDAVL